MNLCIASRLIYSSILGAGGHTIGMSHCSSDLTINYVAQLKIKCKSGDNKTIVQMDPGSFRTFDTLLRECKEK